MKTAHNSFTSLRSTGGCGLTFAPSRLCTPGYHLGCAAPCHPCHRAPQRTESSTGSKNKKHRWLWPHLCAVAALHPQDVISDALPHVTLATAPHGRQSQAQQGPQLGAAPIMA
eukprot:1160961-Pelagomonas_calceolata.AAC.1